MVHQTTEYYATQESHEPNVFFIAAQAMSRLAFPVVVLLSVMLWADFSSAQSVVWFDAYFDVPEMYMEPSYWLTVGHLILPLIYFVINLTSRRYGPVYATAQVASVWFILGLMVYFFFVYPDEPMATSPLPPVRTCMAFVVALVMSQFVCVTVFDQTRGNPWWRAPLYAPLYASFAFCAIFYPMARWGLGLPWVNQMVTHFGFMVAITFFMMIPYYLLRPIVRPLPGYGGA